METNPQGEVLNALEKGEIGIGFSHQWAKVIEDLCEELRFHLEEAGQSLHTSPAYAKGMGLANWMKGHMMENGHAPTHTEEVTDRDDEGGTAPTDSDSQAEETEG